VHLLVPALFPIVEPILEDTSLLDAVDRHGHPEEDIVSLVDNWRRWSRAQFGVALPLTCVVNRVTAVVSA
jgi:hypothetical protein